MFAMLFASTILPPNAEAFLRDRLQVTRHKAAKVDLNGDGRPELLVYANGPADCGSGGCDLYVLTPEGSSYRVVTRLSVSRPPIRVLATTSHGWHDLSVFVAGGGIRPGYTVQLCFDGKSYPGNPSIPPAIRLKRPSGQVVIE